MKKFFSLILFVFLLANSALAEDSLDYSLYCPKHKISNFITNDKTAIKKIMKSATVFANKQQNDKLYELYSPEYVSMDGFSRDVYFDLVKKTYEKYPNIQHKFKIKNITVNGNRATVEVEEFANATSFELIEKQQIQGELYSIANVAYYLEKKDGNWKFISDYIISEQTKLMYGEAINTKIEFDTPNQLLSGVEYTSTLKITPPSKSFVIASITQENIAYPQISSEEIFKKVPIDGILERIFISNKKNLNEYNVASIGLTKVHCKNNTNTVYVTGLGYVINRININSGNKFIKVVDNGKNETK